MAKTQIQHTPADYVGLKIHQAIGTADLDFSMSGTAVLRVTIPLHDLVRLQQESQRKYAGDKLQAYRESKKSDT